MVPFLVLFTHFEPSTCRRYLFELVPLIDLAPTTFSSKLAPCLHSRVFFDGELIFEENTTGYEMAFISAGVCEIVSSFSPNVIKAIADGCYIGDVACLLGCKRTCSVRAKMPTSLFALEQNDLLNILQDHVGIFHYLNFDSTCSQNFDN